MALRWRGETERRRKVIFLCVQKVFLSFHNIQIEPLTADGQPWRCFSYFSEPRKCYLLGSQWDSHKPPSFYLKYLKMCFEDEQSFLSEKLKHFYFGVEYPFKLSHAPHEFCTLVRCHAKLRVFTPLFPLTATRSCCRRKSLSIVLTMTLLLKQLMQAHWKLTTLNKQIIFHHLQNDSEDSES